MAINGDREGTKEHKMTESTKKTSEPVGEIFEGVIEETDDSTGDCLVVLPDGLVERLGWNENSELDVSVDEHGRIVITEGRQDGVNV